MNKKILLPIAFSLLITTLASCGSPTTSSSSSSTSSSEPKPSQEVTSLKTALEYMNKKQSFDLSLQSGSSAYYHDIIYSDNAMGVESNVKKDMTNIYYYDNTGTYQINYNGSELVGSEYRSELNVWDSNLFPTFKGVGSKVISQLDDDENDITISDKEYKILFAELIAGDSVEMINITAIYASYSEQGLTFDITYGLYTFIYLVHDFGKASSYTVKEYAIDGGKSALKVDNELNLAREGIKNDNYMQDVYQYGETESTSGYVMEQGYHEHYFTCKMNTSSYIYGYISLHAPEETEGSNPHPALKGIYYYYQDAKGFHLNSTPINTSPDIIEVMNYPSRLVLWNKLHLLKNGTHGYLGSFTTKGKTYYTDDEIILQDASNNLMGSSFEGQEPIGLVLDIVTSSEGIDTFTIYYQFTYSGQKYCYPIPFRDFGKVDNATLNQIYSTYHTID